MNWTAPTIFIHAIDQASMEQAKALAALTGLPLSGRMSGKMSGRMSAGVPGGMSSGMSAESSEATAQPAAQLTANHARSEWRLLVDNNTLQLIRPDNVAVSIDFIHGKATQRAGESNFKGQPLARALGLNKLRSKDESIDKIPSVIDATAGFGTDAWMMASLGCSVTLLEQSPVLCALLQHAIDSAKSHNTSAATAEQLTLMQTNSVDYLLDAASGRADIIYLDPMYPAARKQALVKKGMQLLHELIGPDKNGSALLTAALAKADYRVVVKRPKGAPELGGSELGSSELGSSELGSAKQWSGQITQVESPNTRFDIYHTR